MGITLVAGPPCAGKNHYVEQHRQDGDVVLDQDAMGAKAYNQAIAQLERRRPSKQTWVIRCLGGHMKRNAFARRIGADDVILLRPTENELLARATQRPNPRRNIRAVQHWLQQEATDEQPKQRSRKPRPASQRGPGRAGKGIDELRKQVFTQEVTCWICGEYVDQTLPKLHPMARTVDHVVELTRGGHPLDRQNARLAHRRCNTARSNRNRARQREQLSVDINSI